MPQNIGVYEFVEHVPGSPEESFESERSQAVRVYDGPWETRHSFAAKLLGYPIVLTDDAINTGIGTYISRAIPHAHPTSVSQISETPFLFATKVTRIEGLGARSRTGNGENAVSSYEKARLTVLYTTPTYEVLNDYDMSTGGGGTPPDESTLLRYVTKQPRPNVDMLSINRGMFKRVDSGTVAQSATQGIAKTIVSCNFQITWHQVPHECVPLRLINSQFAHISTANYAIDNCSGNVNKTTFAGYPQGCVLLLGTEIKPYRSAFGTRIYDITYMFKVFNPGGLKSPAHLSYGHNHIFLHVPAQKNPQLCTSWDWIEVVADATAATNLFIKATGKSIYDWAEFHNLFRSV